MSDTPIISHGFTIVELVVVIILLAILSTVAISRSVSTEAFTPATVAHQIQQELKLAQATAMTRQDTQISFQLDLLGDQWRLLSSSLADGVLRNVEVPAEDTDIRLTAGVTIETLADGGALIVQFNSMGDIASLDVEGTVAAPDNGLSLDILGQTNRSLCLYNTGYLATGNC